MEPRPSEWVVIVDNKRVGTLTNGQPEVQSEFWTVYDFQLTDSSYSQLATNAESWCSLSVHLEEQSNTSIMMNSFMAAHRPNGRIAIRILLG